MKQNLPNAFLPVGIALTAAVCAAYRIPAVPDALDSFVTPQHIDGPLGQVTLTLANCPVTLSDTTQGGGVKLLDFPLGLFRVTGGYASLAITTTSVLLDSLNASSAILWGVGTAAQSTLTLAGPDGNLIPAVAATSSATINVANTATIGRMLGTLGLNGASTAADVYLNIAVPAAADIEATVTTTVTVSGTITLFIQDMGATTTLSNASRMPTAALWANCPWSALQAGELDGMTYFNDFIAGNYTQAANVAASASTIIDGGMCAFTGATAGATVGPSLSAPYGVVELANTTDGETTILQALGNKNISGQVVFEAGRRMWFEARVKVANITINEHGMFVGFAEEGRAVAAGIITTADAMADVDYIGFHKAAGGTSGVGTVYNTVGGSAGVILEAAAATLAADTWIKLGIYCDGTTVFFFVNGVASATSVALATAEVPDGEEMAFYFALTTGSGGGDEVASIDWIKVAQQRA